MDTEQFDALVTAAADGVDFDGLRASRDGDTYTLATPETERSGLSEGEFHAAAEDHAAYVSNWYFWHAVAPQKDDRWAFLRWLEGAEERSVPERYDALADGTGREWGQLEITVTDGGDGYRQYDLRHVEDSGVDTDALDRYDDPGEARALAKHDDDGQYRPLKTAPSLRTGWVFPALDAEDLMAAVDFFYPATVPNWHREREGELDVNHWHETVMRQTGIYGVVRTWDRGEGYEHVNWVAEACCDDSQCLKRREWDYDEDTELDVPRGDGEFPCREPCSLVIAAARQWTKLEGEQAQTYEFELTPSEKEQIEAVIDAVADGRADDIREADVYDDANRYRTRFLRAKLFDDDGNLGGVPTEQESEAADD